MHQCPIDLANALADRPLRRHTFNTRRASFSRQRRGSAGGLVRVPGLVVLGGIIAGASRDLLARGRSQPGRRADGHLLDQLVGPYLIMPRRPQFMAPFSIARLFHRRWLQLSSRPCSNRAWRRTTLCPTREGDMRNEIATFRRKFTVEFAGSHLSTRHLRSGTVPRGSEGIGGRSRSEPRK